MTPNPQANTPDEKLREILGDDDWLYTAKPSKIEALITEARIDEVKRIDPTSDYVLNDLVMSVGDRLTQLKEKQ